MKRYIIVALVSVIASVMSCSSCSGTEVFVTTDKSEVITLVGNDSLYIDTYGSGCGICAYKLHKVGYNEWDGKCLDFNPLNGDEATIITERIKIEHKGGNKYTITFNGSEVYYMYRVKHICSDLCDRYDVSLITKYVCDYYLF